MPHTLGPWHWEDGWLVNEQGSDVIEYAGCGSHKAEVGIADAALIRAAPDLLDALEELLTLASGLADFHSHDFDDGGTFAKARAAIAKARGV